MTEADFAAYATARDTLIAATDDLRKAIGVCESLSARCRSLPPDELERMRPELAEAILSKFRAMRDVSKAVAVHCESVRPFVRALRRG